MHFSSSFFGWPPVALVALADETKALERDPREMTGSTNRSGRERPRHVRGSVLMHPISMARVTGPAPSRRSARARTSEGARDPVRPSGRLALACASRILGGVLLTAPGGLPTSSHVLAMCRVDQVAEQSSVWLHDLGSCGSLLTIDLLLPRCRAPIRRRPRGGGTSR